ncbi:Integrase family protein [Elusimicrobium minutum Pei191]|uniref:Integrase family protein n=1 Tax=Elusimicrobium minutum (strain Pei191) TaxID=445932 RepID=B2KDE6_ELUMP|nr:site-specific integrase [Elusimicrobium minutum]ACC98542.1 Integrase family protein [Elusimicrobium minutum Pei191]
MPRKITERIPVKDCPGLFKVGDIYLCDFYRAEIGRHRKTLGSNVNDAKNYVKLKLAGLPTPLDTLKEKTLWGAYCRDYTDKYSIQDKTTKRFVNKAIEDFNRIIAPKYLIDIDEKSVSKFVSEMDKEGRGKYSINRERRVIIKMLREAEEIKDYNYPKHSWKLVPKFKEAKGRLIKYSKDHLKKLYKNADSMLKAAIMLGSYAGMRVEEVFQAEWTDVNWDRGVIYVQKKENYIPKDYEDREIPLLKPLRQYLLKNKGSSKNTHIVAFKDGSSPKTPEVISALFRRLAHELGIPYTKFHLLRHNFGSFSAEQGIDPFSIQKAMGHSKLETTMIYIHDTEAKVIQEYKTKIKGTMF